MGPGNFRAELQDSVCTTFMLLTSPGHPTTLHQLLCPCGHLPPRLSAFTQQPLSPKMWAWEVEKGWTDATPGSSGLSKGVGSTWATCPRVGLVQTSGDADLLPGVGSSSLLGGSRMGWDVVWEQVQGKPRSPPCPLQVL